MRKVVLLIKFFRLVIYLGWHTMVWRIKVISSNPVTFKKYMKEKVDIYVEKQRE